MSVTGFWIDRELPGVEDAITQRICAPNVQFAEGDACIQSTDTTGVTGGLLIQAATQTTSPRYIMLSLMAQTALSTQSGKFPSGPLRQATYDLSLTSATGGSLAEVIDLGIAPQIVAQTQFALATIDGTAANSNSTTNLVLVTAAGSADDYTLGQLYVNETGQQFTILDDTVSGGVHTFTIFPTPAVAITTGNTVRVVPWGPGYVGGVKLQSSNPQQGISVAVADKTSGHLLIESVNLAKRMAFVRFSGSGIIGV